MKKYLGIDLGSKSIGYAISESGIIANSLYTKYFDEDDYDLAAKITSDVIEDNNINIVVIGLPRHMNYDLGVRGEISIDFGEKLKKLNPNLGIVYWDERSSTKAAIKTLIKSNQSRKKQKALKDQLAATIILQNYLDSINN